MQDKTLLKALLFLCWTISTVKIQWRTFFHCPSSREGLSPGGFHSHLSPPFLTFLDEFNLWAGSINFATSFDFHIITSKFVYRSESWWSKSSRRVTFNWAVLFKTILLTYSQTQLVDVTQLTMMSSLRNLLEKVFLDFLNIEKKMGKLCRDVE